MACNNLAVELFQPCWLKMNATLIQIGYRFDEVLILDKTDTNRRPTKTNKTRISQATCPGARTHEEGPPGNPTQLCALQVWGRAPGRPVWKQHGRIFLSKLLHGSDRPGNKPAFLLTQSTSHSLYAAAWSTMWFSAISLYYPIELIRLSTCACFWSANLIRLTYLLYQ